MHDQSTQTAPDCDALIVGAGIAGLYQLYRLREMGLRIACLEAAPAVGGTWYWNCYPGARVDSQSYIYQYWFSDELIEEWDWQQRFPAQAEVERYLNYVADKFDLRKDIRFDTRVAAADWDEAGQCWKVHTEQGDLLTARYLVSCTGIQVIQTIASQVAELKVFQRTPAYGVPMRNETFDDEKRNYWRGKAPELKQRVFTTLGGFGTYRVPLESGYYDVYNRDNVELVNVRAAPIECFTENGLKTTAREYELDVVIRATGFDAGTGSLSRMNIHGRDGRSLTEEWREDIRSTFGLQVHGYPNLFTVAGPPD